MSRLDRERRQLARERWPVLASLFEGPLGSRLVGERKGLANEIDQLVAALPFSKREAAARECCDFGDYFSKRYDEGRFIADGFGLVEARHLREREGDARIKLLYASLAASLRHEKEGWKP